MARLETKVVETYPRDEQNKIELMEKFGWSVLTRQEIYSQDSHLESRSDGLYSVTETTNFVKITFQRDKEMPYYNELSGLEREYETLMSQKPVCYPSKALRNFGLVLAIIGILFSITAKSLAVIIGIAMIALGGFLFVTKTKKNKQLEEETKGKLNEWNERVESVVRQAESYF